VCWYWYGERYRQSRNFWPLQSGEAKLIELGTRENARGAGYASMLIAESSRRMFEGGFTRLFARIWHSNEPSLRAFEKAGWRNVAFIVELEIRGIRRKLRFDLRHRFFLRQVPTGKVSQPVTAVRS
jgi:RimJ/RimL family protein N-acetyltransferase